MDIIIVLILLIIAISALFGKPINIIIHHKYDAPPVPTNLTELQKQTDDDSVSLKSMDTVIQALNKAMGVDVDDAGNNN